MAKILSSEGETIPPHTSIGIPGEMEEKLEEITPQILRGWLRRAKRKFKNGVVVLKVR